jgi:hypothetical protein
MKKKWLMPVPPGLDDVSLNQSAFFGIWVLKRHESVQIEGHRVVVGRSKRAKYISACTQEWSSTAGKGAIHVYKAFF